MKNKEFLTNILSITCLTPIHFLTDVHRLQSKLISKSNTHPFKMCHIRHIRHQTSVMEYSALSSIVKEMEEAK